MIKICIGCIVLILLGLCCVILYRRMNCLCEDTIKWRNLSDKHLALYEASVKWIEIKQDGKKIEEYLLKNGYHSIAIYGASYLGQRLLHELEGTGVNVKLVFDKNNIDICKEYSEMIDAIIITPITYYDEIKVQLRNLIGNEITIISLDTILFKL